MDPYIVALTILGIIIILTAWLPMVLRLVPLSLPILCIAVGMLLAWSLYPLLPPFNPLENREFTERMTEIVVIVALMGAGLKIDRPVVSGLTSLAARSAFSPSFTSSTVLTTHVAGQRELSQSPRRQLHLKDNWAIPAR
jgi:NhaP-type Na+/H+ or K+/H+ antiporter